MNKEEMLRGLWKNSLLKIHHQATTIFSPFFLLRCPKIQHP